MSQTDTFIATLTQTTTDSATLLATLNGLNADLQQVITVLGYSKTVDTDIGTLSSALTTASEVLEVATLIPDVGEAAEAMNEAISLITPEVNEAQSAADAIEAEVAPIRDGLQEVQQPLTDLINGVQQVQTSSQTFLTDFSEVAACIDGLPDGTYKTQGQNYLEGFSGTAQPIDAGLNSGLEGANTAIGDFTSALGALETALDPLQDIDAQISAFLNDLYPAIQALTDLQNFLENTEIKIPLGFYNIDVSLYDILTKYGAFAQQAIDAISQDVMSEVLSALNISWPQIPGLSDILNLNLPSIPGIPDFSGILNGITGEFGQLQGLIPSFNLTCPPQSPDDQVPGGGTYP